VKFRLGRLLPLALLQFHIPYGMKSLIPSSHPSCSCSGKVQLNH
jgi:hypothetical protein